MTRRLPRHPVLVLGFLLVLGCATYQAPDWSSYQGPGKEYFLREEVEFPHVPDPMEPMNRVTSGFNHALMVGVVQPISLVYRTVLPRFLRTGIGNAFDNAYYPVRLLANLLQGKGGGAWRETQRFGINTTYGVLGLWDRATELGIEPSKEDFGQTFGAWGWRDSTYFVMPVLGPSTLRDSIAGIVDVAVDPTTYVFPASLIRDSHRANQSFPTYQRFVETNFEPYELARILMVLNRELRIDDYDYEMRADDSGETQTLDSVFLTHVDDDFPGQRRTHHVELPHTGKKLAYSVWMQAEPAPITYLLPGTGGHRLGNSSLALAEIVHGEGRSAVTISSTLNHEFIEAGSTARYPGFVPVDAHDVHLALDAIDQDLRRRYPGRITERRLGGLSLGAAHTLFIAAAEANPSNELLAFDAYIALNAPVSLAYSCDQLDSFYNVPLRFEEGAERNRRIQTLLRKVLDLSEGKDLTPGQPLPFAQWEAEFLIGLSFRKTIADIVVQTQSRQDPRRITNQPSMFRKALTYREAYGYSFMEYLYAFVLPSFAEDREDITYDEAGARRLLDLSDLRSIADVLRANDRTFFISNRNDFLLRPEEIRWVEEIFGDRAFFFDRGGHLGNLWREDIQEAIVQRVEASLP